MVHVFNFWQCFFLKTCTHGKMIAVSSFVQSKTVFILLLCNSARSAANGFIYFSKCGSAKVASRLSTR